MLTDNMSLAEVMQKLQSDLAQEDKLNQEGKLTVGQTTRYGFYRLLNGDHANKVIWYSGLGQIDSQEIIHFINSKTWAFKHQLAQIRCEATTPTFRPAIHPVEPITWYADSGEGPFTHEW